MKILILAGGGGTRLWPLSREKKPKQLQKIFGDSTLLRQTYENVRRGFPEDCIFIATSAECADDVRSDVPEIPQERIIIEPARRNTAVGIGYAAMHIARANTEAIIATVNADHAIRDVEAYVSALACAGDIVRAHPDHLVLLGVTPTYPETGYGYIEKSKIKNQKSKIDVYEVERFVEKPPLEEATEFVASGNFLWNAGIFVFRADALQSWMTEYQPELAHALANMHREPDRTHDIFQSLQPMSLDYGIVEKMTKRLVIPVSMEWSDIGHWQSVHALRGAEQGTIADTPHIHRDSRNNLIVSTGKKLISTVGIHDMIIVETNDAILLCPKDRAQEVRHLVETLKEQRMDQYL